MHIRAAKTALVACPVLTQGFDVRRIVLLDGVEESLGPRAGVLSRPRSRVPESRQRLRSRYPVRRWRSQRSAMSPVPVSSSSGRRYAHGEGIRAHGPRAREGPQKEASMPLKFRQIWSPSNRIPGLPLSFARLFAIRLTTGRVHQRTVRDKLYECPGQADLCRSSDNCKHGLAIHIDRGKAGSGKFVSRPAPAVRPTRRMVVPRVGSVVRTTTRVRPAPSSLRRHTEKAYGCRRARSSRRSESRVSQTRRCLS